AVSLEQQSRMKLSDESLDQQIAETYAAHQAQPENVDLARRLGALNEQKNDFESAISWYQYAADLTKGTDAGLVRRVSDLRKKSSSWTRRKKRSSIISDRFTSGWASGRNRSSA